MPSSVAHARHLAQDLSQNVDNLPLLRERGTRPPVRVWCPKGGQSGLGDRVVSGDLGPDASCEYEKAATTMTEVVDRGIL
jgi:hypothetical protein